MATSPENRGQPNLDADLIGQYGRPVFPWMCCDSFFHFGVLCATSLRQTVGEVCIAGERVLVKVLSDVCPVAGVGSGQLVVPVCEGAVRPPPVPHDQVDARPVTVHVAQLVHVQVEIVDLNMLVIFILTSRS